MAAEHVCDYCAEISNGITLYCSTCDAKMCPLCYNRTSGGRVQFITGIKTQHLATHTRMRIITVEEKIDFVLVANSFFLGARSYISFRCTDTITSVVHLEQNKVSLTSWLIQATASREAASLRIIGKE